MKLVQTHRKIIRRKYSNRKNLGIAILFFTISNFSIFLLFIKLKGTNENLCPSCHSLLRTRRQITDNKIDNIPRDGIKGSAPNLITETTKTISPTGQKFVAEFIKKFREITELLDFKKEIRKTHVFITRSGAKKQSFHYDTDILNEISVIHIITKRYIWVRDKRVEHLLHLKAGDVLLMHGNCCHAGAANEYQNKTYTLYVSVDFSPQNTFPCGEVITRELSV